MSDRIPLDLDTPIGTDCFVDLGLLQKRLRTNRTGTAPAKVVSKLAYLIGLEVDGKVIELDVANIRRGPIAWTESDKSY